MSESPPPKHLRTQILEAIRDTLAQVPGMHADRVVVGAPSITRFASGLPVASIAWSSDLGRRADGAQSDRSMRVVVAVMVQVDPSQGDEPLLQLGETYDDLHAALETLAEGDLAKLAMNMVEDAGGVEASPLEADGQLYSSIASQWTIQYRRPRGGT